LKKQVLLVVIALFALFFSFFFIRENVLGADAFYYAALTCKQLAWNGSQLPLEQILFNLIPCNVWIYKIILFINALFFCVSLYYLFKACGVKDWSKGILFVITLSFIAFALMQLENDFFALPFMILALSQVIQIPKWKPCLKDKHFLLTCLYLFIAAGFWGGAIYFLMLFIAFNCVFLIPSIILLALFEWKPLFLLLPNVLIQENQVALGFFLLGYLVFTLFWYKRYGLKWFILTVITIAIATLNAKFWVLAVPFVAVNFIQWFEQTKPLIKSSVVFLSIFMLIALNFQVLQQYPTNEDIKAIKQSIQISPYLNNDFGLGYLIIYEKGHTNNYGVFQKDLNANKAKGYILTIYDLNCSKINLNNESSYKLFNCR
jgi:hypothetical protein